MIEQSDRPILDTDIWVFLVMTSLYKKVIRSYGYFYTSDTVNNEILKWNENKGDFKNIATIFEDLKAQSKVRVISIDDFSELEKNIINHQLANYGLKHISISEKNKGEFVSFLYALQLGIKRFKTNDHNFADEIGIKNFPEITLVDWDSLLDKYVVSVKEKGEFMKVVATKEKKMKNQKEQHRNRDPRWDILKQFL